MENRFLKIEELAVRIGSSVPTISSWYRWKRLHPEHEMAQLLPDFVRKGPHGTRNWYESDVAGVIEFKNSIPQGRNGLMGDVTQKYVKKTNSNVSHLTSKNNERVETNYFKEETSVSNNVKYITKYQKENTVQINLRLSKKYDADIVEWLNSLGDKGKATYLKELIREDMASVMGEQLIG